MSYSTRKGKVCAVSTCKSKKVHANYYGVPLCNMHYRRQQEFARKLILQMVHLEASKFLRRNPKNPLARRILPLTKRVVNVRTPTKKMQARLIKASRPYAQIMDKVNSLMDEKLTRIENQITLLKNAP